MIDGLIPIVALKSRLAETPIAMLKILQINPDMQIRFSSVLEPYLKLQNAKLDKYLAS
jgi:hypothetical protein